MAALIASEQASCAALPLYASKEMAAHHQEVLACLLTVATGALLRQGWRDIGTEGGSTVSREKENEVGPPLHCDCTSGLCARPSGAEGHSGLPHARQRRGLLSHILGLDS